MSQPKPEAGSADASKESIGTSAIPSLSPGEMHILTVFWSSDTPLTVRQVCRTTGVPRAEVTETLAALRSKGVVCVLNTVIESYRAIEAPTKSL